MDVLQNEDFSDVSSIWKTRKTANVHEFMAPADIRPKLQERKKLRMPDNTFEGIQSAFTTHQRFFGIY